LTIISPASCVLCYRRVIRDLSCFPTRRSSDLLHGLGGRQSRTVIIFDDVADLLSDVFDHLDVREKGPELLGGFAPGFVGGSDVQDRKSTRLNSSHVSISYAVFCLKKKNNSMAC